MKIEPRKILYTVLSGSRLYGLDGQNSDYDIKHIYVESPEQIFGVDRIETGDMPIKMEGNVEVGYRSLGHFCKLLARSNPNVIELLFAPDENILFVDPLFDEIIRKNREGFLSKKFVDGAIGMSNGQKRDIIKNSRPEYASNAGYNMKAACHSFRMLHSAIEMLTIYGSYSPKIHKESALFNFLHKLRWDPDCFDSVESLIQDYDKLIKGVRDIEVNSSLRREPSRGFVNRLMIDFYMKYFGLTSNT